MEKKLDVERFLEKIKWSLLEIPKQTVNFAETDVNYMKFIMKSFSQTHSIDFVLFSSNFFFN